MKIMRAEPRQAFQGLTVETLPNSVTTSSKRRLLIDPVRVNSVPGPLQRALQQWEDARDTLCRAARRGSADRGGESLPAEENGMASEERVVDSAATRSFLSKRGREAAFPITFAFGRLGPVRQSRASLKHFCSTTLSAFLLRRICWGESNGIDESDDEEDDYGTLGACTTM